MYTCLRAKHWHPTLPIYLGEKISYIHTFQVLELTQNVNVFLPISPPLKPFSSPDIAQFVFHSPTSSEQLLQPLLKTVSLDIQVWFLPVVQFPFYLRPPKRPYTFQVALRTLLLH